MRLANVCCTSRPAHVSIAQTSGGCVGDVGLGAKNAENTAPTHLVA
jgi:hypothetical protein